MNDPTPGVGQAMAARRQICLGSGGEAFSPVLFKRFFAYSHLFSHRDVFPVALGRFALHFEKEKPGKKLTT